MKNHRWELCLAVIFILAIGLGQWLAACGQESIELPNSQVTATTSSALPTVLAPSSQATSPGLILYSSGLSLWQMSGDGTKRYPIVSNGIAGNGADWPQWSPTGQHFTYLWSEEQKDGTRQQSVWIADKDGTNQRQVSDWTECVWAWWQGGEVLGFSTGTGDKCSRSNPNPGERHYFVYDLVSDDLKEPFFVPNDDPYTPFRYSPNGDKVVVEKGGEREFFIVDLLTGKEVSVEITADKGEVAIQEWSPDGSQMAFTYCYRQEESFCDLYTVQADGQDLYQLTDLEAQFDVKGSTRSLGSVVWSPNGSWLAFTLRLPQESLSYLGIIPVEGGAVTNLGIAWRGGVKPVWSPDSTKIAFVLLMTK